MTPLTRVLLCLGESDRRIAFLAKQFGLAPEQGTGGSKLATWPAAWKFAGGTDLVLSTAAGSVDVVEWWTPDGAAFYVTNTNLALA